MMKTSRGVIVFCLLTVLSVSCVGEFKKLNSIDDLKEVLKDQSVPRHALILLFWFANEVRLDNNDALCIGFNPRRQYGSHPYGNFEGLLGAVPEFSRYFTVGNLYKKTAMRFPVHFREMQFEADEPNMDRIIMCVREEKIQNSMFQTVGEVFLTQHFSRNDGRGTEYDPDHTYIITNNLLRQLRMFSSDNNSPTLEQLRDQFNNNIEDSQLWNLRNTLGGDARLGLLCSIVMPESYPEASNKLLNCRRQDAHMKMDLALRIRCEWQNCGLEVQAGENGNARISWKIVTEEQLNPRVAISLYRNQKDRCFPLASKTIQSRTGSYDTSVPLNEGLQVRLDEAVYVGPKFVGVGQDFCRGKEFKISEPVSIIDDTKLQMFVKDGYACFRLFKPQTENGAYHFDHTFYKSWVGLYADSSASTTDYLSGQWQWVTKFDEGPVSGDYDTFEFCTGTKATQGLEARFIVEDYVVWAWSPRQTPPIPRFIVCGFNPSDLK